MFIRNMFIPMAIIFIIFLSLMVSVSPALADESAPEGIIVAMGDSLTEGYGVSEEEAYPALLQGMLSDKGYRFTVINSGVSGETSSGALSRIRWVLRLKPDIVMFEEQLPADVLQEASQRSLDSDVFIVIGSTLTVYPAALMPQYAVRSGASLAIINLSSTPLDHLATVVINARAGEIMTAVVERVKASPG